MCKQKITVFPLANLHEWMYISYINKVKGDNMPNKDRKEYFKAWRQAHREDIKAWRQAHREEYKAWYQAHREEQKEYMKAWRQAHREEQKAYYQAHREERKAQMKGYYQAHKEEQKDYQKSDTNSLGQTKHSIRAKSSYYLFNTLKHTKLKNYEIHHCFGYDDYRNFIYIPKSLHLQIHQFLRDNEIDADTDHYNKIVHLIIACEEYVYIKA